jgi:ABC-2 type transport system permease protein
MIICTTLTSVSIVREKENGTMEILLVSPFNPTYVVLAKAVPYLVLSLLDFILILLLSVFVLDVPIRGSLLLLFMESMLFIISCLSLGLLISSVTQSQQTAMLISMMGMMLPTILFTGFIFPLENMPFPLRVISNLIPSRWYYFIVKAVMLKGLGFGAVWKQTLVLAGMTVTLLTISIKRFKIRLA